MRTANSYPHGVTRSDADSYADFIAGVRAGLRYPDTDRFFAARPDVDPDGYYRPKPYIPTPDAIRRAANLATDFDLERPNR